MIRRVTFVGRIPRTKQRGGGRLMRSDNLRAAPSWVTPELVGRILALAMSVDGKPMPIRTVPTRGMKPVLAIVESGITSFRPRPAKAPDWSHEEDEHLRQAYAAGSRIDVLAEELGRTEKATYSRAKKIGLTHPRDIKGGFVTKPTWSAEEDELLKQLYGNIPPKELPARIGRSMAAIFNRAHALDLEGYRGWTRAERRALHIAHRRGLAIADVAAALGRKAFSVSKYATNNGLCFGRRPLLAVPLTLEGILALEDPAAPLRAFRKRPHKSLIPPVTHSRRTEREAAPPSPTATASPRIETSMAAAADVEALAPRHEKPASETGTASRVVDAVPAPKKLYRYAYGRKRASEAKIEGHRPVFEIAFRRGIAVVDLAHALHMPVATTSLYLNKAGFAFGKRPPLADPLTIDVLLVLGDPDTPVPETRADRHRRLRLEREARDRAIREARPREARQAARSAASREPALHAPRQAGAHPSSRAAMDRTHKQRSDSIARGHKARAAALLDAGESATRDKGVHVLIAMRAIEAERAEQARLSCPIEQAKRMLQRRYAPVCSMAVYGGDPNLFIVGGRKNVTRDELLEMAQRVAA